jgi:uncharacterized phage protein gp47/JayE
MPSTADIVSNMVASLRVAEPNLDTSIGTPVRKILDVVGEAISEAYTDGYLINYQYDIDSKAGGDLDDFCALFGITRIPAQRATGIAVFTRPNDTTAATTLVTIAPGTQLIAMTNPLVYVQTTVGAAMSPGQTSVGVPVQAVVAGAAGNVAAGLLNTLASSAPGVTSVINDAPLVGGLAQETDDALRTRFKQTVFRALSGTSAMYQAVAQSILQDPSTPSTFAVSNVNVLGSSKRYREQVQIVGGTATSTLQHAAYIFADNVICGPDIDAGVILAQGTAYSFTPTNPTNGADATTVLTALSGMPDGFYDLDFEYVPQASRNDPANTRWAQGGINNRVDIWCNGSIAQAATQSLVFTNALTFSATTTSPYYISNFVVYSDTVPTPAAGQIFIPLAYGPIIWPAFDQTITINGVIYNYGTDYWIVKQKSPFGDSARSLYGLIWTSTTGRIPANGFAFTFNYTYNRVPSDVQNAIEQWRLVGTDALAHAGIPVQLQFNLAVVYDIRFDSTVVNTNINTALSALVDTLGFESELTVSQVLKTVSEVAGVTNVRFLTSTDNSVTYAITQISNYSTTQTGVFAYSGRATDIFFADDHYPVFYASNLVAKANNSFMVGA